MTKATCGDCGVSEGEIHECGCDMEVCPFCGGQLLSCSCIDELDNPWPELDITPLWHGALEAEGRIPYIEYPVICAKCGALYPEFFKVPDSEWGHYIQLNMQDKVICRECYEFIKEVITKS